jgi:hypothetical protein
MATGLSDEELAELARRLRNADTGRWSETGLRELVAGLGWEWRDSEAGPVLSTGLGTGDARLRPVGKYEERYAVGQEYVGLHVPIEVPQDTAIAKADAFRRAAEVLTETFGPAPIMGVYGDPGPFYDSPPSWGSPFRRWWKKPDSLELQAGEHGPELLLLSNDPVENWHWRQSQGNPYELGGFFGTRRDPANAGLGYPGMWTTDDWEIFGNALGEMLTTLPAETRALGIELSLGMHGLIPGAGGPWVFHLACDAVLELGLYDEAGIELPDGDLTALGWIAESTAKSSCDHLSEVVDVAYHSVAYGPGEVDGHGLARLLVETARLLGIESPKGLSLIDRAQTLGDYRVDFYGLTLTENP